MNTQNILGVTPYLKNKYGKYAYDILEEFYLEELANMQVINSLEEFLTQCIQIGGTTFSEHTEKFRKENPLPHNQSQKRDEYSVFSAAEEYAKEEIKLYIQQQTGKVVAH